METDLIFTDCSDKLIQADDVDDLKPKCKKVSIYVKDIKDYGKLRIVIISVEPAVENFSIDDIEELQSVD